MFGSTMTNSSPPSRATVSLGRTPRLDRLAGSGSGLAERLREAESEPPPQDSAYWKALAYAEDELRKTVVFQPGGRTTDASDGTELELDFLQPADKPDLLGKLGRFDIVRVVGRPATTPPASGSAARPAPPPRSRTTTSSPSTR